MIRLKPQTANVTCPHCGEGDAFEIARTTDVVLGTCPYCGKPARVDNDGVSRQTTRLFECVGCGDYRESLRDGLCELCLEDAE